MADICPTCGQALPSRRSVPIRSADQLVAAMRIPQPPSDNKKFPCKATRDVFEGYHRGKVATGRFYITHRGGEATRAAIEEALERRLIRLKYERDGYWCLADGASSPG